MLFKEIGSETSGAGAAKKEEKIPDPTLWVPIVDSRRNIPRVAELSTEPSGLAQKVTAAVSSREGAGARLAELMAKPASGIISRGSMDSWGGARLQAALDEAIQSYPGSIDDLARDVQSALPRLTGVERVEGLEKLGNIIRGARSTFDYISTNKLPEGSKRFASLELDVLAKVDVTEVDFGADGKIDEVRFVQVKSSEETARKEAPEIVGAHRKLLSSYIPSLARVLAYAEASGEVRESEPSLNRFSALAEASATPEGLGAALSASPETHLALRLGAEVPKFREHLAALHTEEVAEKMLAAAAATPVPMFRVLKLARGADVPPIGTLVRQGGVPTRFVSVIAAGDRVLGKLDVSAAYYDGLVANQKV